jgi:hypothetical protein
VGSADRDFVEATAAENARLREIAGRVKAAADEAVVARDVDELIAALAETVDLLDQVVEDLVGSRAEGAAVYANDPEFRRLVDEFSGPD